LAPDRSPIIRAAILASGNGSNAENIVNFANEKGDRMSIPLIITDQRGAGVIRRAEKLGIPCPILPVDTSGFPNRAAAKQAQEDKILSLLKAENVRWLFLAGYMRLLSSAFLQHFYDPSTGINRVVNVHPALLPAFAGKDAYRQSYDADVSEGGITLHFVDDGMDTGPIIAQKSFPKGNLSFDDFCAAGRVIEHALYRQFLESLLDGSWPQNIRRKDTP
jgi:phosphoribosylglycinamide formyltransferase-1